MDFTETGLGTDPKNTHRSVLIVDDQDPFSTSLAASFRLHGFQVQIACDLDSAAALIAAKAPGLIVCELKMASGFVLDELAHIRSLARKSRMVIATGYPSIATATWSTRQGMDAYLAKPVNVQLILSVLGSTATAQLPGSSPDSSTWPSLDRTIWEYVNHVFVAAGSMSGAARRLKVDRRSLRRMLAKHPPLK